MSFPSSEFDQLVKTFESIAAERSAFKRRFWLVSIASRFGLPKSEFRKLFDLWLLERSEVKHDA